MPANVFKDEMPFPPLPAKIFCLSKNGWNINSSMKLSLIPCPALTTTSCVFIVSFSTPFLVPQSYAHVPSPLAESKLKDRELVCVPVCICVCVFYFALPSYFVICFLFFKIELKVMNKPFLISEWYNSSESGRLSGEMKYHLKFGRVALIF